MPIDLVTKLSQLGTAELSLVNRGANRKRYAITKSQEDNEMDIKAILNVAAEGEDQMVATLKAAGVI